MKGNDQFHDSESEDGTDVYDLYNACNGEILDGVINIRRLDELDEEEREVLNVPRLKQWGEHVLSGCAHCEHIINTVNRARLELRTSFEESRETYPRTVRAIRGD